MKKFLLAATLIASVATPALAKEAKTFTRDGETYVYTTAQKAGSVLIRGRSITTGATFSLTVRGDHVSGFSNGRSVSFAAPSTLSTEVAAN